MRHKKNVFKIGRTTSHRRCLIANMLKSLIEHGRIETTVTKAKELRRHADKIVTIAKKDTLAGRRKAIATLMVRYNQLTSKEARQAKEGDTSAYNTDRKVIKRLFEEIAPKYTQRNGGYTRLMKTECRRGDNAEKCIIEFI